MANYKPDLSCQSKFIPIDFAQQIIPGTFEYALSHIVDKHLDLTTFDDWYNNDNGGAAAYPPSVMLKIILFGYSRGLVSSRRIAQACETNITFMSLSGDEQPHYTSIASFVAKMKDKIEPLFTQVLMICDREGLIGRNMFAIDGCKIKSNASKEWSGTFEELERKQTKLRRASRRIIERHQAQDGLSEDEVQHDLKQKEKLDKSADKIKQFLASNEEKIGNRKKPVKSNVTDPDSAKMTTSKGTIQGYNGIAINDDKQQIIMQAQVWGSVGEQQTLKPAVEQLQTQLAKLGTPDAFNEAKFTADSSFHSEVNLEFMATTGLDAYMADTAFRSRNPLFKTSETYQTEKEKRRLKRSKGRARLFNSTDFYFNENELTCRCPAGKEMWLSVKSIETAGRHYVRFSGYLKDCRVCPLQAQCMRKVPSKQGRQVQFETNKADKYISYTDKMRVKIDSSPGRRQYSKRLGTIEPVFGNITVNKGMNKFTLRGQEKVNAQWQMYCLVHNIEKLRNSLH
ncbi:transposase, IS4 family [Psychromonas ingrahamii 37]|uniref:Transposase, IS4 family n=1 Tax=Psychromonas ingrahamii (strain DSM 17664 / CCUG 51855 / 37) TaxID=357804 RepID=A1SUP8_PSYIN|nr:transposase [Psychromonas ingrahamii]ABM03213.1 transposase, IS4 family [Psychromonas ingrahamii 37]